MDDLIQQRAAALDAAREIEDAAAAEKRAFNDDEKTKHEELLGEARKLREAIEARKAAADERAAILPKLEAVAKPETERAGRVEVAPRDPGHYRKDSTRSWFVDKANAELRHDDEARKRMREQAEYDAHVQKRDLYIGSTTGQELSPPLYLQELFVEGRVASAIAANLCTNLPLPAAGRTVTVPKQTGNAGVGIQTEASPLSAITETDAAFGDETQGIYEYAGVQDLSNFLVERSTPGADMIIMRNLARQVARKIDEDILHGSGSGAPQGIRGASGINAVTYTAGTPSFAEAQAKIGDMLQQIHTGWFDSADAIIVHPRRWAKWSTERDNDGRLVVGQAALVVNPTAVAANGAPVAQGLVGSLHGVPVYVDANIKTNLGSGTNEDTIYAMVRDQALLWLGNLNLEIDRSVNFKTSGVAVRARQYAAFMCEHAPEAFGTVTGTGLATPTFA